MEIGEVRMRKNEVISFYLVRYFFLNKKCFEFIFVDLVLFLEEEL